MANIDFTINLQDFRVSENKLIDAIARHLRSVFKKVREPIRARVGMAAAEAIRRAPEYTSLLTGKLRGELGVIDAAPVLEAVIRNIAAGCRVKSLGVRRVGKGIDGGLRIELLKGDYSEVLKAPGRSFESEGGHQIDWLRWLTLEGDRIIVADHRFVLNFSERSRTGTGIMIRPGNWRVPPEFAGTDADNWLTRALGTIGRDILKILQEEIQRNV